MTKLTDEERHAREAALKKACPPGTLYYNSLIVIEPDQKRPQELHHERCSGHDTMEGAITCAEANRKETWKLIDEQTALAQKIVDKARKLGFKEEIILAEFRVVIVKETTELVEEHHR